MEATIIFHGNYIENKNGTNAEMLFTDIGSFIYITEIENAQENFHKGAVLFEISYYPKDSEYHDLSNLIVCKMKNETCSVPINGFIRLKSKTHTFTKKKTIMNVKKQKVLIKMLLLMN